MPSEEPLREAIETFVTRVRQDLDVHGQSLAVELTASVREELERAHAAFTRLLTAIRVLDAASSLRGILEALADGVRAEQTRSVLMLLEGERLRVWRAVGYADGEAPTEVTVAADTVLVGVVDGATAADVSPESAAAVQGFLRPDDGRLGRFVPLAVGGNVVAVLYCEGPGRDGDRAVRQAWAEPLEVMVRHAAARLENVTSIRTVEALTRPA